MAIRLRGRNAGRRGRITPPRQLPRSLAIAARAFARVYLDELLGLEPAQLQRAPCFGYGRGGVAYALLRAATASQPDPDLLARAATWAAAGLRTARRFRLRGWPKASYSRGLAGLHAITARIAHARGDSGMRDRAVEQFMIASRSARGSLELYQGMAGRLAGAAALFVAIPDLRLRAHGDELARRLTTAVARGSAALPASGIAHGWPGVMLGLLQWERVAPSQERASVLHDRLRALSWTPWGAGWAHGDAGLALLLARAYARLGDPALLRQAREAGERAFAAGANHANLIWGGTGIAYCLLAVADVDPAGAWRERAHVIAGQTLANVELPRSAPYGVWSGLSGLFCLVTDLLAGTHGFPGIEV